MSYVYNLSLFAPGAGSYVRLDRGSRQIKWGFTLTNKFKPMKTLQTWKNTGHYLHIYTCMCTLIKICMDSIDHLLTNNLLSWEASVASVFIITFNANKLPEILTTTGK